MMWCRQVEDVGAFSNLESAGTAGTVGNVCVDVQDSEVRLHGSLVHVAMWSARGLGVVVVCCNA